MSQRSQASLLTWLITLVCVVVTSNTSHAAIIQGFFGGTLNSVDAPLSSDFSPGTFFSGSFTFDSSVAPTAGSDQTFAVFNSLTHFEFSIGGNIDARDGSPLPIIAFTYSAASNSNAELQVDNSDSPLDFPKDRFAVVSRASEGLVETGFPLQSNATLIGAGVAVFDFNNTVFGTALAQPTNLTLSDFEASIFFVSFEVPAPLFGAIGEPSGISGNLSYLQLQSQAVPEPASMLIWGTGLALAGLAGYRRRAN